MVSRKSGWLEILEGYLPHRLNGYKGEQLPSELGETEKETQGEGEAVGQEGRSDRVIGVGMETVLGRGFHRLHKALLDNVVYALRA